MLESLLSGFSKPVTNVIARLSNISKLVALRQVDSTKVTTANTIYAVKQMDSTTINRVTTLYAVKEQ